MLEEARFRDEKTDLNKASSLGARGDAARARGGRGQGSRSRAVRFIRRRRVPFLLRSISLRCVFVWRALTNKRSSFSLLPFFHKHQKNKNSIHTANAVVEKHERVAFKSTTAKPMCDICQVRV